MRPNLTPLTWLSRGWPGGGVRPGYRSPGRDNPLPPPPRPRPALPPHKHTNIWKPHGCAQADCSRLCVNLPMEVRVGVPWGRCVIHLAKRKR